jgi:hypothetical protein
MSEQGRMKMASDEFVFVSKSYAQSDPDWDVDEDWPDDLPVWVYRPS